jgi:hypothetical protein
LAFLQFIEVTLWFIEVTLWEFEVTLWEFEVTLWPTIRCDFFLRFRSKKTPPLSASVMCLVEA